MMQTFYLLIIYHLKCVCSTTLHEQLIFEDYFRGAKTRMATFCNLITLYDRNGCHCNNSTPFFEYANCSDANHITITKCREFSTPTNCNWSRILHTHQSCGIILVFLSAFRNHMCTRTDIFCPSTV